MKNQETEFMNKEILYLFFVIVSILLIGFFIGKFIYDKDIKYVQMKIKGANETLINFPVYINLTDYAKQCNVLGIFQEGEKLDLDCRDYPYVWLQVPELKVGDNEFAVIWKE